MILAAAMLKLRVSPFTTACWGHAKSLTGSPSIRTISGPGSPSADTARPIAKCVALRILSRSISSTLAMPEANRILPSPVSSSYKASRREGDNFLESFSQACRKFTGSTTAPATTGPANGPRPASSTPATTRQPADQWTNSKAKSGIGEISG